MCDDAYAIRRELSEPADLSPEGEARRRFLQYTLAGAAVAGAGISFGLTNATGASTSAGAGDRILVLVELLGGNDGLNTLAPVDNGRYRDLRGGMAVGPEEGLRVDGGLALHPSLGYVKQRYDGGDVALVQGIGYGEQSLSHFDSMALWMGGRHGLTPGRRPATGWIGRYLDGLGSSRSPVHAVAFDGSIPLHMRGAEAKAVALRTGELPEFGTETGGSWRRMYDAVERMDAGPSPFGRWADELGAASAGALRLAQDIEPAYRQSLSGGALSKEMVQAARLINVDVGVRIVTVQASGFDTHQRHQWDHGVALRNLDEGIRDFFTELDSQFHDRVTLMTFSEFGRRPLKNGSQGTDHGAASVALVMGKQVSGGLHGSYPSLSDLDSRGNLKPSVDFRSLYGTVMESWLGADGNDIVGGAYEGLALFGAAPDGARSAPVLVRPPSEVDQPAPAPVARHGYLVLTDSGQVHNYGRHATYGSATGKGAAIARHPSDDGYWVASGDGAVFAFGDAKYHGGATDVGLRAPIVDLAPHPNGSGYWMLAGDGGVFGFGEAGFHGGTGHLTLAAPMVGMAVHPDGRGYWLAGADGGVFAFGSARFWGSAGAMTLAAPIVSIVAHPNGQGYWLLAADGGVFSFGKVGFHGSVARLRLAAPVVDMAVTPSGKGYWMVGRDGGVFTFGDATYQGAPTETGRIDPVTGIAS